MAFPADPQDLIVEAHLGGDWRDLVTPGHVRDAQGVQIERGVSSEGASATASSCSFTLDNRSGAYTPRNPASVYFGALGRNAPVRVAVGLVADDFDRTVSEGWGTSASGETWAAGGAGGAISGTDTSVSGGLARHSVPAASAQRRNYIDSSTYSTVDVRVTVTTNIDNVLGGDLEPANLTVRGVSSPSVRYNLVRLVIREDQTVTIGVESTATGSLVTPVTVPGLVHTSAQALTVRAVVEGQTIHAKVWAAVGPEPAGWHIAASDPQMPLSGWVGVRSGVGVGNSNTKPILYAYDDFEVRVPRWSGEVAEWPVTSDTSGEDVTTSITGSGLLRRLRQGQAPLRSAMYRAHLAPSRTTPVAYWSMEDGADSTSFASAVGGPAMVLPADISPASSSAFPASDRLPVFGPNTTPLIGQVGGYTSTGTVVVDLLLHVPSGGLTNQARLLTVWIGGSTIARWIIYYATSGHLQLRVFDPDVTQLHDSGAVDFDLDDRPLLLRFTLTQDGSDVDYDIATSSIGEASVGGFGGTVTGRQLGRVTSVNMGGYGAITLDGLAAGHLVIKTVDDFDLWESATQAWAGEVAGDRIVRLCGEEGIGLVVVGDPGDTEPMGPQSVTSLLDLVEECAAVDGGLLAEPAGALGLLYRTRVSLYSQDTRVTLDQTAGQVQPALEPVDDDRYIANEVTATRDGGSSATAVQTTGPLAVSDPPDGVGRYDTAVTLNAASDSQLPDQARWRVHLGTIDEARYPHVEVNLAKTTALRDEVLSAGLGDRVVVTHNKPGRYGQGSIDGLAQGYTEYLARYEHTVAWNLTPSTTHAVGVYAEDSGDTGEHLLRYDPDGSELVSGVSAGGTSMSVATASGPLWTVNADDCPMQVTVGGIVVTVTAISGAGSPQTFTINSAPYALSAGAAVSVVSGVYGL